MMYGFTVKAWLILGKNDVKIPFATIAACERAYHTLVEYNKVAILATGAATEKE